MITKSKTVRVKEGVFKICVHKGRHERIEITFTPYKAFFRNSFQVGRNSGPVEVYSKTWSAILDQQFVQKVKEEAGAKDLLVAFKIIIPAEKITFLEFRKS